MDKDINISAEGLGFDPLSGQIEHVANGLPPLRRVRRICVAQALNSGYGLLRSLHAAA